MACWIDFNRDGVFSTSERAVGGSDSASASQQTIALTFSGFGAPVAGTSYLRCRLATAAAEVDSSTGPAATGEVEDYQITITQDYDFGDAPDTGVGTGTGNYNTTLADNGPRHAIVANLRLGAAVDAEVDGQPTTGATGDDTDGATPDDEDGVLTLPTIGTTSTSVAMNVSVFNNITVLAGDGGLLDRLQPGRCVQCERARLGVSVRERSRSRRTSP